MELPELAQILERLERDPTGLMMHWPRELPRDWLETLAELWGTPLEHAPVYASLSLPYPSSEDLPVTDFLDEKRQQIADRLKELEPLVDEHRRLEAAASALAKLGASAPAARLRRSPPWPPPLAADRDARGEAPNVRAKQPQPPLQRPLRPPPRSKLDAKNQVAPRAAARAPLRRSRPCRDSPASRSPNWPPRWDPGDLPLPRAAWVGAGGEAGEEGAGVVSEGGVVAGSSRRRGPPPLPLRR